MTFVSTLLRVWWFHLKHFKYPIAFGLVGVLVVAGALSLFPQNASKFHALISSQSVTHFPAKAIFTSRIQRLNAQAPTPSLRGTSLAVVGPSVYTQQIIPTLKQTGVTLSSPKSSPNTLHFVSHSHEVLWELKTVQPNPQLLSGIESALSSMRAQQFQSLKHQIQISPKQQRVALSLADQHAFDTQLTFWVSMGIPTALALSLCFLLAGILGSVVGWAWDYRRATGALEPWALCQAPLWTFYGAEALTAATVVMGSSLIILSALTYAGISLSWLVIVTLSVFLFCWVWLIGLWSMFATMLFHHPNGRLFARWALSPLTLILVWGFRFFTADNISKNVSFFHPEQLMSLLPHLVVLSLVAFVAGCGLIPLIEWRIGPMRAGLRKC